MTLTFTVYGVAQPKGNMRAINVKGMKHPIITETNRSVRSWSQLVAQGASAALQQLPKEDRHILVSATRCCIAFYLPRPKSLLKRPRAPHLTKPDLDKLTRGVLDALTGVIWADDACVVELVLLKFYAAIGEVPRVDVRVDPSARQCATPASAGDLFDTAAQWDLSLDVNNPQEG